MKVTVREKMKIIWAYLRAHVRSITHFENLYTEGVKERGQLFFTTTLIATGRTIRKEPGSSNAMPCVDFKITKQFYP